MTDDELSKVRRVIASLPAVPHSYSYEGLVKPTAKSNGYADYHVHSICGGPDKEGHCCIGNVIAKDEDTAARLAHLVEVAPRLLDEVDRLRKVLMSLSDDDAVGRAIEAAYQLGGDGVHCAYKEVQSVARKALSGGE